MFANSNASHDTRIKKPFTSSPLKARVANVHLEFEEPVDLGVLAFPGRSSIPADLALASAPTMMRPDTRQHLFQTLNVHACIKYPEMSG